MIARLAFVVGMAVAAVLGVAAWSKLRAPRRAAEGMATYGVPAALRVSAAVALGAVEAVLAVAVALGVDVAAYAGAALVAVFTAALAAALARGRAGAPCACFGSRSRVGLLAVARNLVLAGVLVAAPSLPQRMPSVDEWLGVGLLVALAAVAVLTVAVLALAREVGLLRLRVAPEAALDVAAEGPPVGSHVALPQRSEDDRDAALALAVFSSEGCRLCQTLAPTVAAFAREPRVALRVFDEVRDADVWRSLRIPGSPYAVAVDRDGAVRAKGTFNTYGQLESILATAEQRLAEAHA